LAGFFRGGSGSVRLQIDEELDWTIRLELNDLRAPDYKAIYTTDEDEFEVDEPFVIVQVLTVMLLICLQEKP